MTYKKKLIEVALPLDAINVASAREKSIRHGHPSTLHLWWARRPLAAARAVIFAQMVDDPSSYPDRFPTEEAVKVERARLHKLIAELVRWENINNKELLAQARTEIERSWREECARNREHPKAKELFDPEKLPAFHDPFAGGGALPLEAQRLGLEAHASDLNPVAVLINKAMIEIPPRFVGSAPIGPLLAGEKQGAMHADWSGTKGLAEDVRRYGHWMREEARKRIGHLYPEVLVTKEMTTHRPDLKQLLGKKLTVIAWVWARTVKSPNPAFQHLDVPLASTFMLSTKLGKEAYVEPIVTVDGFEFVVRIGAPTKPSEATAARNGTKLARGANFQCVLSETPIEPSYIKSEGMAGRIGARLMAVVAEGLRGRIYLSPSNEMENLAKSAKPKWIPDTSLPDDPRNFWTLLYGLSKFSDLFTARQLVALTTFAELIPEARERVKQAAITARMLDDGRSLDGGGSGATAYADAVSTYLAFAVSKSSDYWSSICIWRSDPKNLGVGHVFSKQALPMTWDFAEANPFSDSSGNWLLNLNWIYRMIATIPPRQAGRVRQEDAATQATTATKVVSTDPPYYDNIGYADLSDFFYVWLRRTLKPVFPALFGTLTVPKAEELVATPYRHGNKANAEAFFLNGMTQAMRRLAEQAHPAFPVTIYYAFKQSETGDAGTASTGWETFLEAVLQAGFTLTGTWPMRTELGNRTIGMGTNALASSIVLVCRPRETNARTISRGQFLRELKAALPQALKAMMSGAVPVAPVDLAQAAIGPGMAVFSRCAAVLESDDSRMSVRTALQLINQTLDASLSEQEGDYDPITRFAVTWFETRGLDPGAFGEADQLARARNVSVQGAVEAGITEAKGGKVRLLKRDELDMNWNPETDSRLTIWECTQHLIRVMQSQGELAAAELFAKLGPLAEPTRELAYRLYGICERKRWTQEGGAYNALVVAWPELARQAGVIKATAPPKPEQSKLAL